MGPMGGPSMGGGRGMMPGTGLVRRGAEGDADKKLPKGLVGRVWRDVARPYRGKLAQLGVAISVASILAVLPAKLIEPLVNALSDPGPDAGSVVVRFGLGLMVVAVAAAGASLWQRWLSAWIGEELIYDLRARLYDHVQRMPLAFFTRTQTGALISRL